MNYKPSAYSVRSFIQELRKDHPKEVFEVDEKVSVEYETTAYYSNLKKQNSLILFNNVEGFEDFSLVTNIFGSEERLAKIAGFSSIEEVIERWSDIANGEPSKPVEVADLEDSFLTKLTGEDLNVFRLPIPSHYELDGSKTGFGRYITSGLTTTIDPENDGIINLSFSRIQPFDRNKFAFDAGSHGHLWKYLNLSRQRREKLEMTILIGTNPIFYLLAASFIDNEFGKLSKFQNFNLVPGFKNKIPLPSDTEIAIEAEFLPEETFDEGPFAEYAGYMGYDSTKFVAEVKSLLMKRNPIYYDIQPSNSSEHVNLFSIPRSSLVMKGVREALPKGPYYQVVWPHYAGRFLSLGCVDNTEPGLAKQLGMSILGLDPLWNKIVFVNEGKTELTIERALVNLAQSKEFSERNLTKISNVFVISSDPTRDKLGNTGKIIFVTSGVPLPIKREIEGDSVKLMTRNGGVLISHEREGEQKVNVVVADDIETKDEEQVGWAMATRLNPDTDIRIERDRITFFATRKVPKVATIPEKVKKRIEMKFGSLADGVHR